MAHTLVSEGFKVVNIGIHFCARLIVSITSSAFDRKNRPFEHWPIALSMTTFKPTWLSLDMTMFPEVLCRLNNLIFVK